MRTPDRHSKIRQDAQQSSLHVHQKTKRILDSKQPQRSANKPKCPFLAGAAHGPLVWRTDCDYDVVLTFCELPLEEWIFVDPAVEDRWVLLLVVHAQ